MATTAGWASQMQKGIDFTSPDETPVRNNNQYLAFFYIIFILVGSFFILNLFVGIVISNFNREKERIGKDFLLSKG